jgi:ABC-type dipeptide/oligopeptide/nickel transport system permease subunit
MRRAVEKLSWLVFSLVVSSVVAFAALGRLSDQTTGRRATVPLLVNLEPRNARDLTAAAVRAVVRGGNDSEAGARELERLGGAALPHVLGSLDALDPVARGRLSLALVPIARRMGIAEANHLDTGEQALVFWTRFWQDRSADFRGAAVRRRVARLGERALALRQKEVLELDTFAVPELVDALGHVEQNEDVLRVSRLVPALRHATGRGPDLAPNATLAQAAAVVSDWRRWSLEHSMDFTTLDGPGRLSAVVTETRYFRWLLTLMGARRNHDDFVLSRARAVFERAERSLSLSFAALAAGLALGAFLATRFSASRRRERLAKGAAFVVASIPSAFLAVQMSSAGIAAVLFVLVLGATALVTWDALSSPVPARYREVLLRALLHASPLLGSTLTGLLAAEASSGLPGLGSFVRASVRSGDLDSLMLVALAIAGAGLFVSTLSAAAAVYRPVADDSLLLDRPSRARLLLALGPTALLALFAAVGPFLGARAVSQALGQVLFSVLVATAVAAVVATVLGFLAGMVSHSADVLLARAYEVSSALPTALVAGALLTLGGIVGPILFGVLRGVEAAFLFRTRLAEGRRSFELEPISLGRTPILPQLRRLLPDAIRQPLICLSATGGWFVGLVIAALLLGVTTPPGLEPLAVPTGPAGSFVALSVALAGTAFLWLLRPPASDDTQAAPVVLELTRRISDPR